MDVKKYTTAIDQRRDAMGVSKQAVADKLGLSWEQTNKKLQGDVEFKSSELVILADWWNVSLDDLVGRIIPVAPVYKPALGLTA